jgi:Protein involved in meta-pathway of phenol degradation
MKKLFSISILSIFLLHPGQTLASNARDYIPLAPGTTIINLYYSHAFGNELYAKNNKVSNSANLTANICILRPIYYTSLGPFIVDPQAIIPYGEMELNGERSSGLGDIRLHSAIWLINDTENKFFLAYAPFFTIPTGQYRRESSINMGANRWSTDQQIGIGKGFGEKTWVEWVLSAQFFTDNTNVLNADNKKVTSSKDPLFGTEVHASYNFTKPFFASLDYYFSHGGENSIDGHRLNDRIDNHTIGTSFFYMLNEQTQVMLDYQIPVAVQNGIKTSQFTVRLAYVF